MILVRHLFLTREQKEYTIIRLLFHLIYSFFWSTLFVLSSLLAWCYLKVWFEGLCHFLVNDNRRMVRRWETYSQNCTPQILHLKQMTDTCNVFIPIIKIKNKKYFQYFLTIFYWSPFYQSSVSRNNNIITRNTILILLIYSGINLVNVMNLILL